MANRSWVLARGYDPQDFPFYDGRPTGVPAVGWFAVVTAVAAVLLSWHVVWPSPARLVLPFMLAMLAIVLAATWVPGQWTTLFRSMDRTAVAWTVALGLAAWGVVTGVVVALGLNHAVLPGREFAGTVASGDTVLQWAEAILLLVGEEVLAVLLFLGLLGLARSAGLDRRQGVGAAWVGAAAIYVVLVLPCTTSTSSRPSRWRASVASCCWSPTS